MKINTNIEIINIFNKFEEEYLNILEEENRNRVDNLKEVVDLIDYLNENNIEEDDINIEVEINYFLKFKSGLNEEQLEVINEEKDILILKIVKQKLTILYKIKQDLRKITSEAFKQRERKFNNLIKRYLDKKEVEYVYGLTEKIQNSLREKNILKCTQIVQDGKILYEVGYMEEFMDKYTQKNK